MNIGGGEPHDPPRLLRAARLRDRPRRRREVLDQRRPASTPAKAAPPRRRPTTSTCRSRLDGADAATNDAVRGEGSYATARRAMDHLAAAGFGPFKISVVVTRHNVEPARRVQGAGRLVRRASCASPGCGRRAAAPTPGTSCTRPTRSSATCTTGCSPRRARPHRRLVLPPVRARRAAARPEPLRRRAGRVPDRPGRRRLRLPVRAARGVPGRHRARRRRLPPGVAALRAVPRAARAAVGGRLRVVRLATTRARAAAWRPSSSPACRSTAPTPSACSATASRVLAAAGRRLGPRPPRPLATGADSTASAVRSAVPHAARHGRGVQLLEPLRARRPGRARNRVVFGPHETNLGRGRALSDRHVAYYARRGAAVARA